MIKERVRKEFCLLLILAVIVSLASEHMVYASVANYAVNSQEFTTGNTASKTFRLCECIMPVSADNYQTVNDSNISDKNKSVADEPLSDQDRQPSLNTNQLHLIAGGAPYELHVSNAVHASYTLSAEASPIVELSNETAQSVTITPNALPGQTILTVKAEADDGTQKILFCKIIISELTLSKESVDLYMNDEDPSAEIDFQGVDLDTAYYESGNDERDKSIRDTINEGKECTILSGNPGVANAWFRDGTIYVKGLKKGITNIRIKIYDVPLSINVHVHHYTLNKYAINTYKGSSIKNLKLKGADGHKITWVSGNKNVASVSKTGIVSIKGIGTTKITAKVNGRKIVCIVSVSSKTAYRAVKKARAISKKKNIQYSNEMRMADKYYDCSSLVYRCYQPYGIHFGSKYLSLAPTASEEARWCAVTGREIATEAVDLLSCKLVPGDTIYYSFNGDNGHYMNIDHTAIFAGYAYNASIGYYGTIIEASSSSNTVAERIYYALESIILVGRPSRI